MLVRLLSLVALLPLALADVEFSSPSAGESIPAGSNIFIKWTDHHGGTPISELSGYTIFLIAGGDSDSTSQQLPSTCVGDHTKGTTSASIPVNAAEGPEGSNAYYLKIVSTKSNGDNVINYSPRFTLTGMTGSWADPSYEQAYKAMQIQPRAEPEIQERQAPAAPPANPNAPAANPNAPANPGAPADDPDAPAAPGAAPGAAPVAPPADPAAGAAPAADDPRFTVSYQFQTTGVLRFAPMQDHPPKKITKQDDAPMYPTSKFKLATTALPTPSVVKTQTLSRTELFSTRENTVAPAAQPTDDMQKFLARWKD